MPGRKRAYDEISTAAHPEPPSLLTQIRNRWEFSALYSFIHIFGDVLKIDRELDIDMLEEECLKHDTSSRLAELGLQLLKHVSSHRGLTLEIFDEYTRRQYQAKAPHRNLYGDEEEPKHFNDFDVFTKLKVLYQLAVWNFHNPDKIRERMPERDYQQTAWRIETDGEDSQDRQYFVLDDNRLYRLTPAPPPPAPKPKPKAKAARRPPARGRRQSKRQKIAHDEDEEMEEDADGAEDGAAAETEDDPAAKEDDGFGGAKWECLAVTLEEYQSFLASFKGSRYPEEKALVSRIRDKALPAVEEAFQAQARKAAARARELATLEKMASAKRSTRISARHEKEREAQVAADVERKKREDLAMAHREQERILKIEEERDNRMMTREQRLKEREMKRILHEENLEKLKAEVESADGAHRSERSRQAQLQKTQEELDKLKEASEEWDFDCSICGVHGKNWDDGSHSLQCEKCSVWQHSKCHGLTPEQAEADDFHFTCASCSKPKSVKITNNGAAPPAVAVAVNGDVTSTKLKPKATAPRKKKTPAHQTPQPSHVAAPAMGHFATHPPAPPRALAQSASPVQHPNSFPPHVNGINGQAANRDPPTQGYAQHAPIAPHFKHYLPQHNAGGPPPQQPRPQPQQQQQQHHHYAPPTFKSPPPSLEQRAQQYSQHPRPEQQPSQHHNPYTNGFNRQLPASALTYNSPPPKPAGPPASPQAVPPHLNATQGATDVRFSPNHSGGARQPSQSYSPTSNRPAPAALSPTKQISPLQNRTAPPPPPQQYSPTNLKASSPTPQLVPSSPSRPSPSPVGGAFQRRLSAHEQLARPFNPGHSPVKQSSPPAAAAQPGMPTGGPSSTRPVHFSTPGSSFTAAAAAASLAPNPRSSFGPSETPSKLPAHLPPAPTLSPSVNVGRQNLEPPVKRTPEKMPTPLGAASAAMGSGATSLQQQQRQHSQQQYQQHEPPRREAAIVGARGGAPAAASVEANGKVVPDHVALRAGSIVEAAGEGASASRAGTEQQQQQQQHRR